MKLETLSRRTPLDDELEHHVERRLRFALTRFGRRVRRVSVLVEDVNVPEGGTDVHCTVRVELSSNGVVAVHEANEDAFTAVTRAAERASRAIARRRGRPRRRWERSGPPSGDVHEPATGVESPPRSSHAH